MSNKSPDTELDELVVECLDRMDAEGPSVIAELCARDPSRASRLRERIETLKRAGLLPVDGGASIPERLGEYRLVERLGGGGMGVVYVAEHVALPRRVALKVVRPDEVYFGGARARFRREAEALAELSHESIVRIHTVGEHEGLPFFVMELVEGISLHEWLESHVDRDPRTLRGEDLLAFVTGALKERGVDVSERDARFFSGSYVDTCFRIGREVASALEHAHAHGVLHRDVKPSNVMITPRGRVVLLDFGLATRSGASRLTRSGAQLGSLAWMAPEQVEGDSARIGPRTDVYGLGVVMYEMLTLTRAFDADTTASLSLQVLESRPKALRSVNPSVSRDGEIVCAKAMDGEIANRYETAGDLARDIGNVLVGRPIDARRASTWNRVSRWVRRHPARAASAVLAVLLIVGGPLVYSFVQHGARKRIEAANAELARANKKLEHALAVSTTESERAVNAIRFLTDVSMRRLKFVPQAEDARRELLEGALRFHKDLVEARADEPELAVQAARSKVQAGLLYNHLGREAESREMLVGALGDIDALAKSGIEAGLHVDRALVAQSLSESDLSAGRLADARTWAERAVEAARTAVEQSGGSLASRSALAQSLWRAAKSASGGGATPAAIASWKECRDVYARLIEDEPQRADFAIKWAQSCMNARALFGEQRVDMSNTPQLNVELRETEAALANLQTRFEGWISARPHDAELLSGGAECLAYYGQLLGASGQLPQAVQTLTKARDWNAELLRDFPRTPQHKEREQVILSGLAVSLYFTGKEEEGLTAMRATVESAHAVWKEHPERVANLLALARVQVNLSSLLISSGQYGEAATVARAGAENYASYLTKFPDDTVERPNERLANTLWAQALCGSGEVREAAEKFNAMPLSDAADDEFLRASGLAACIRAFPAEGRGAEELELLATWRARALDALETAVRLGFASAHDLRHESLDPIRDDPRFAAIVETVARKNP